MSPFVYAIPAFLLLIIIEISAGIVRKKNYYRVNDAINSLSTGMLFVTTSQIITFSVYTLMFNHWSLIRLDEQSIWVWVVAFVAKDFFYYWHHRMGHEINILWAAHAVHHQSEEYNLTTALRQTSTGSFFGWIFYIPMALAGIPPLVFVVVSLANLLYQFWVHTRHISKLGWFEWIFVTPSNHRVHHAKNRRYLDKNYGGVFIIWDRIFGSFEEEDEHYEPIRYGTLKPLRSWNPFWANCHLYVDMWKDTLATNSWKERLTLWFRKTGYRPKDIAEPMSMPDIHTYRNYNPASSTELKVYASVQYALMILATTSLVAVSHIHPFWLNAMLTGLLGMNLVVIGWLLEKESGLQKLEAARFGLSVSGLLLCCWLSQSLEHWLWQFMLGWGGLSLIMVRMLGINQLTSAQPQQQ